AVAGERGYTGESDGATDQAIAFDRRTGKTLWRAALGETYRGPDGSAPPPHGNAALAAGPRRDAPRPRRLARRPDRDAGGERRPRLHAGPARAAAGARRGERPRALAQRRLGRGVGEGPVLRLRRLADPRRRARRAPGGRSR